MADFFNRRDRDNSYDRRDSRDNDFNSLRGNNFDRRYSERNSGSFFDRPGDGRSSRDIDERLNRTLPPIADPSQQYQTPVQQAPQYVQPQPAAPQYCQPQQQSGIQNVNIGNVVLYCPKDYAEVEELIGHLINHEPAIVDLQSHSEEEGQRFLDFLSGAIYALQGSMQRISGTIFLLTPTGVSISAAGDVAKSIEERRNKR